MWALALKMNRLNTAAIFLLLCSAPLHAEEPIEKLLGYLPGSESSITSVAKGAPLGMERVPVQNSKLKQYFLDLQLFLLVPENTISGVAGRKALSDRQSCVSELNGLLALLKAALPEQYSGEERGWQFQASNGAIVARATCSRSGNNPFPLLEMIVQHTATAVNDHLNGAIPGSVYWSHPGIGLLEPPWDRPNGATSGSA